MLSKSKQAGVTLVELMVGITIAGILFMLAVPSYSAWIQNQQIRAGAESILNGIQLARSSAVNNNAPARFVLCGGADTSWQVLAVSAAAAAPSAADSVCGAGATITAGNEIRVQDRFGKEGSRLAQVNVNNLGIGVTTVTTVTFNSLGRVAANADGTAAITSVTVSNPLTPSANSRPLQINVQSGGNTRMCDPSSTLAGNDPRHC